MCSSTRPTRCRTRWATPHRAVVVFLAFVVAVLAGLAGLRLAATDDRGVPRPGPGPRRPGSAHDPA